MSRKKLFAIYSINKPANIIAIELILSVNDEKRRFLNRKSCQYRFLPPGNEQKLNLKKFIFF